MSVSDDALLEESLEQKPMSGAMLRRLFSLTRPYRGLLVLNLVGMLLARQVIACVGMVSFQVLGWIFAVLQAGLAVDAIVTSVRNLAPIHVLL